MKNSYPTGPCTETYNPGILPQTSLMMLKDLVDKHGLQMEMTLKPAGIKLRIIKKIGVSVKKSEKTISNKDIAQIFTYDTVMQMIYEVSNNF